MYQQLNFLDAIEGARLRDEGIQTAVDHAGPQWAEIWKDVVGYEGVYQVSNYGNIRSLTRKRYNTPKRIIEGKLRPSQKQSNGYLSIMLSNKGMGKRISVHRLVAEAFIPNPKNKPVVNHINSIRDDNRVENLEWVTQSENLQYMSLQPGYKNPMTGRLGSLAPKSKKLIQVDEDGNIINGWGSVSEVARSLGINSNRIYQAIKAQRTCLGMRFKYI